MNPKDRYLHIDFIRATAILLMIVTHVLSWHFGTPGILAAWNAIHFVVVGLVFCSAYLFARSHNPDSTHHHLRWFLKRILRLYVPFVIYLAAHYTLWILFPGWLRGYGIHKSLHFIISSLALTGGVDIGWLTTLFIQFAVLFPYLLNVSRNTMQRRAYLMILILFSLGTVFWRIPVAYTRSLGWLPWSLIAVLGFMYSDAEKSDERKTAKIITSLIPGSAAASYILYLILAWTGRKTMFTDHKYPPDIYYLTYGILFTSVMLKSYSILNPLLTRVRRVVTFISRESYTLFFVHMIVLDTVMTRIPSDWMKESILITGISIILTYLLAKSITVGKSIRKADNPIGS